MFGVEACYQEEDEGEVRSILEEEIARIREEPVPEEEVAKSKTMLKTGYAYSLERSASMAGVLGRNSACGCLEQAIHFPERVDRMDGKSAQDAFNRCCPEGGYTLGIARPEKKV
jgi:predicted Zn-dependent peptidase